MVTIEERWIEEYVMRIAKERRDRSTRRERKDRRKLHGQKTEGRV